MSEGVDYAFSRPSVASLVDAGKTFAIRYGGPGTSGKWLTPQEALDLSAAGITIVANAEGSANGMLGGRSTGASWARSADPHFQDCGMPPNKPIYYSADFDVTPAEWPAVADALRGAADVTGPARVGLYGGYRACQWARRDGVAALLWQTYAWSTWTDPDGIRRLHWLPGTHLQQYRNGVIIGGADCDLDRSMTADFGQWFSGDDMSVDSERHIEFMAWRVEALIHDRDRTLSNAPENPNEELEFVQRLKRVEAKLDQLLAGGVGGGIGADELAAKVAELVGNREAIADRARADALDSDPET